MNVIADGLHASPAAGHRPEERPCQVRKLLRVAVSAAVEKRQDVVRQILNFPLSRAGSDFVRLAAVAEEEVGADFKSSRGCEKTRPDVAERVEALPGFDARAQLDALRLPEAREPASFAKGGGGKR